jgi:LacI family transcriptional regulator
MRKPPTVSDIARTAHVSTSTVSRVLTGSSPVHPEKRAAVLAAIEQLQFRPNLAARTLVRGRSMAVGVLTQSLSSQFYGEIAQGVEEGLAGSEYHPIFASGRWQAPEERNAIDLLLDRQVDGLIILGGARPEDELRTIAARVPTILVGRKIAGMEHHCIWMQNYEGAYQAVRYLLGLKHRQIAHITGISAHTDAGERRLGYEAALRDAGIPLDERLIVEGNFVEQGGLLAVETLIARGTPFTAIFAANDQLAYGVRLGLYRRGLRVPDDVSLVGFDDVLTSAFSTPPLTTVSQGMLEQGRRAAHAILRMIAGEQPDLQPVVPELIVRESAALLRG